MFFFHLKASLFHYLCVIFWILKLLYLQKNFTPILIALNIMRSVATSIFQLLTTHGGSWFHHLNSSPQSGKSRLRCFLRLRWDSGLKIHLALKANVVQWQYYRRLTANGHVFHKKVHCIIN